MAPGIAEIRVPGERSARDRAANLQSGSVQLDALCWEDGLKIGKKLGVAAPQS
jgi:hypothetical protein